MWHVLCGMKLHILGQQIIQLWPKELGTQSVVLASDSDGSGRSQFERNILRGNCK